MANLSSIRVSNRVIPPFDGWLAKGRGRTSEARLDAIVLMRTRLGWHKLAPMHNVIITTISIIYVIMIITTTSVITIMNTIISVPMCGHALLATNRFPYGIVSGCYLSNATCLIWPHLFYASLVVSRIITICYMIRHC